MTPRPRVKRITSEGEGRLQKFAAELGVRWLPPFLSAYFLAWMDDRQTPYWRIFGAICHCTFDRLSQVAIDARGKRKLSIEDLANGIGLPDWWEKMDEGNARRALRQIQSNNYLRTDMLPEIWLTGKFKLPIGPQPVPDEDPGDELKRSVQTFFKPYYVKRIMALKPRLIRELVAAKQARIEKSRFRYADFMYAGRLMDDREDDNTMARFGVPVIRIDEEKLPSAKKIEIQQRRARAEALVPLLEKHIQTFFKKDCNNVKSGLLQTAQTESVSAVSAGVNGTSESASGVLSDLPEKNSPAFVGVRNNGGGSPHSLDPGKKKESSPVSEHRTELSPSSKDKREELKALLLRWLGKKLAPQFPGPKLLDEILITLGTATLADLAQRIQQRLDKITAYGMVIGLARDCAKIAAQGEAQSVSKPLTAAEKFAEEYHARKSRTASGG